MAPVACQVRIRGRVQGVGYRAWVERTAAARGLAGWVRNRAEGSVEAVFAGEAEVVAAMVEACRRGPSTAIVSGIEVDDYVGPSPTGFTVLPTA